MKEFLRWDDIRIGLWSTNTFTWDEVAIIEEIVKDLGGGSSIEDVAEKLDKKPEEKKKKFIRIIAKLEGKEYIQEKPKDRDRPTRIRVKDVEILVEKLNIKINV